MCRLLFAVSFLAAASAAAQDFESANKLFFEQSYSRGCDGFTAFLKANPGSPLEREAKAKRAVACTQVGRGNQSELAEIADKGEKDFGRAWALAWLFQQGSRQLDQALPLLKQAAQDDGRQGTEAKALIVRCAFIELERNTWNRPRVKQMAELVLAYSKNVNEQGRARFLRGQAALNDPKSTADGERELLEVGKGGSDHADDALYAVAQYKENNGKYAAALELYDGIVKRFSPQTSNVRSDAESRAREIRRPYISCSTSQVALPGLKPQVSVRWRNVKNAKWSLRRVDPLAVAASPDLPDDATRLLTAAGPAVKSWAQTLEVPAPYAPGSSGFELDVREPGAYVLEVSADGQTGRDVALVTQTALITKSDKDQVLVWLADVETGKAVANAKVGLWIDDRSTGLKQTATTDAKGLARFKVADNATRSMVVWANAGEQWAYARAGDASSSSWSRENLAYIQTDRPLYKPAEQVGFKVYLRSREGGPSAPIAGRRFSLQINDPTGRTVASPELTTTAFGTAAFTLALPKNAALGQWNAQIAGNSSDGYYQQTNNTFRVEEYKPPEYTVTVEPVGNPRPGDPVKLKVRAKFYSGGPVANAQGRALVTISGWQHAWSKWPEDVALNDPYAGGYDEERGYGRGYYGGYYGTFAQHTLPFKTGADGTAELLVPALSKDQQLQVAQTDLQYTAQVFVTDASRREIQGSGSVKVSSHPYFVDLRTDHYLYRPGERVTVKLRAEDANGRAADPEVVVRLLRVAEDGSSSRIAETRTRLSGGKGLVQLDADAIGMVRAQVLDGAAADQAAALASTDLWLTSDSKPMAPPGQGFEVYLDRAPLKAGQKARALVVSPVPGSQVLVSLESDVVHSAQVVELIGRARFVELPLSADMAPNCVLTTSGFVDSQFMQQQRPLTVQGSTVELEVKVGFDAPAVEPGTAVTAKIQAAGVKGPLETALTVVDEALFAIAPERTDFLSFFGQHPRQHLVPTQASQSQKSYMQRPKPQPKAPPQPITEGTKAKQVEPLEPVTAAADRGRDLDDERKSAKAEEAPARGAEAQAAPAASAAGGHAAGPGAPPQEAPVKVRTDFGSSAGWFPELASKKGGPLSQQVKLTDSLTSWKATATVVTEDAHLGQGSGSIRTAKALMVRLQAPRFFIEGDEVVLSAVVESHLAKAADVDVSLSAPGFKELSPARKTLKVEPDKTVRFDARFKVVDLGERTIRATARGGGTADAMEWKLPALVHGSAQRQFFAGRLTDRFQVEVALPDKRKPALTRFELALAPSLLAVMLDGLPFLAEYPYGCVEQTLSRFVPAVIARRTIAELKLPTTRTPADLDDKVQKGLERLYGFQHGDGGWGWWSSDDTNTWMTAYVIYALSLTREAGVAVDAGVLERGRAALLNRLGKALQEPETHAFAVFALAQSGGVPKAAVDKDYEHRATLSARARAQLAIALLQLKDPRARIAVENLDDVVKAAQARPDAAVGEANDAWSTSAAIEATAFTVMAYARYDLTSPLLKPLTDFLVLRRNGGRWRNTRDTAFAIYALAELAKREGATRQAGAFVVSVNGKEVKRLKYTAGGLDLTAPLVLPDAAFKAGKNVVEVKRDGAGTGYYAATWDVFNQNDFIKGVGGDVKVQRTYTLLGRPSTEKSAAPTEYGMPVESGVRVRVDLEITANKAVEFVMVEDLKPAGFEAVMLTSGPEVCNFACAHAELRTDRVAMFLTQVPVGVTRVSYELRAEVPGRFAALPARVEAMYAPEIQATADEMRFEVRDEPGGVAAQ